MRPPSVDRIARDLARDSRLSVLGHGPLVRVAREAIRLNPDEAVATALELAVREVSGLLHGVINGTGVLLHTNLGRAPRPRRTTTEPTRYSNLEFDLDGGGRGSRRDRTEPLMAGLCGAEAALIVNNCAGALVLVLRSLAQGRGVAVSRGELVEIGGGFRIPEVLEQSGAHLVEVGTTNRTRRRDFENAIANTQNDVAMLLSVHTSNYRLVGFTEATPLEELVDIARRSGTYVISDIGSGLLDSATPWLAQPDGQVPTLEWLRPEPAVRQTVAAGADLVVFSCDKLLGGPQGGAIVGKRELVERCAKNPLARALRPGGLVIGELQETLLAYERRDLDALPFWKFATASIDMLTRRAQHIVAEVGQPWCTVTQCASVPGGGTLPETEIPSVGIALTGSRLESLRRFRVPVIARATNGETIVDLRTIDPDDDALLIEALRESTTTKSAVRSHQAAPLQP